MLKIYSPIAAYLFSAVALCTTSGCFAAAAPGAAQGGEALASGASEAVPTPSTFQYLTRSTKVLFLSPAALYDDSPMIESIVIQEQCHAKSPDPVFFVPRQDDSHWHFAGRLDPGDDFRALEYRNWLMLGLAKGNVQFNTWPVELVSLADM